ncbi:transmembrane and TPR repeat-containing protein 2-like [Zootermopsis nevadensis]|uniref:transmembrane and TPR repeat-containing protein 2-like n=1 Tax=Zootermopsis nevadensis TaxID=136037 RepID=UPI000B8EE132|nr:transmembrane and TPR repeat-containing protein 2-like [Zootermopsis nevadensis]
MTRAILSNQDVLPSTPLAHLLLDDFWGTPLSHSGSHGSYRPLCTLSFRLNYLLGGFRAWGYHLVNILLHCLATSLVVRLSRLLFPSHVPVAITGLLFATHPIHTEAVAGVVGRADIAACIFYLLSFQCYVAHVRLRDRSSRECRSSCAQTCYRCFASRNDGEHGHWWKEQWKCRSPAVSGRCLCETFRLCSKYVLLDGGASRGRQWLYLCGCVLFAACAILSKETGVTVLVLCAGYDVLTRLGKKRASLVSIFTEVSQWLPFVCDSVSCTAVLRVVASA